MTHPDRNEPLKQGQWDFSFSGLKTAVLRHVRAQGASWAPSPQELADLCASFQRSVVDALLDKTFAAARWYGSRSIGIAGGVSANSRLRADLEAAGVRAGLPVFVPTLALSTDNAAMIAAAGLRRFHAGARAGADLNAEAGLALAK
jgi:N6-L-threonylcarbamoyladenine synthase